VTASGAADRMITPSHGEQHMDIWSITTTGIERRRAAELSADVSPRQNDEI
jgi:hypothetical protein